MQNSHHKFIISQRALYVQCTYIVCTLYQLYVQCTYIVRTVPAGILTSVDIAAYSQNPGIFYCKHIIYDEPCISCTGHPMCLYGKEVLAPFDIWIYIMAGHMGASTQVAY